MERNKISFKNVLTIILAMVLFCLPTMSLKLATTSSFLTGSGTITGVIETQGISVNVYQKTNGDYAKVEIIDLLTDTFATDKTYSYDVKIQNDEPTTVTTAYYMRWQFLIEIDGKEYNISKYIQTTDSKAHFENGTSETDGWFYYWDDNAQATFGSEAEVTIMGTLTIEGSYDAETGKYGSILDSEFSGKDITFKLKIEGSSTAWENA